MVARYTRCQQQIQVGRVTYRLNGNCEDREWKLGFGTRVVLLVEAYP
jgi:hypothetical protein